MKITLDENQKIFFTSDTHFTHKNICEGTSEWAGVRYCRPFQTLDEMNTSIIETLNSMVGENDILFHLGDWSFGGFDQIKLTRDRIKCKNVHIVLGNHDHHIERNKENIRDLFSSVSSYKRLTIQRQNEKGTHDKFRFILSHFPIASWHDMNHGVMHLHGHIHTPAKHKVGPGKMLDVGVDGSYKFEPYSLDRILDTLKDQPIKGLLQHEYDHHE